MTVGPPGGDPCPKPGCTGRVVGGACGICGTEARPARPGRPPAPGAPAPGAPSAPAPPVTQAALAAPARTEIAPAPPVLPPDPPAPLSTAVWIPPEEQAERDRQDPDPASRRPSGAEPAPRPNGASPGPPAGPPSTRSAPRPTGSHPTGRGSRGRSTQSRQSRRIGGGLVEVPRVPYRDPASAVMANPEVPEDKRFCSQCGKPVGRATADAPAAAEGRCPYCGNAFSFRAKLGRGDLIGGQYEVLGAIAHGGIGWIYLARDHNVNDRWVVLKGLIDTGDPAAMAAAVAEKEFLAQVEHANIVKIYNFVEHADPDTGNQVGYIVMEYVGGQSLRQIALANTDPDARVVPLPLARVLAYGLEVLPAMAHLHGVGLIFSDLKPDNVIQTDAQLKLIDLGAVRHVDDVDSPIFFTSGYSAPEIGAELPSVASDIYTVGRMLAVLSFDFAGYTDTFRHTLPPPGQVPLFRLFGSYHRLLQRATHPDPDRRFASADDMADQVTGVLREVLAMGTREPRPGRSALFGPEVRTFGAELGRPAGPNLTVPAPPAWAEIVACLPVPLVDQDDPAAGLVGGLAAGASPVEQLNALRAAPPTSVQARLSRARALLDLGDFAAAHRELLEAAVLDAQSPPMPPVPYDWRISWTRGLLALAARQPRDARRAFEHVYDVVPGELAPKLAIAVSAECAGDHFGAARMYELVWRTDRAYVSAAFGLARTYLALGDRAGALEVLESVPDRSSHFLAAQMAVIAVRTVWTPADRLTDADLLDAAARIERLNLDAERQCTLAVDVLRAALGLVGFPGRPSPPVGARLLGCELTDRGLRFGLESRYRALARLAGTAADRVRLVDLANSVRPVTLT